MTVGEGRKYCGEHMIVAGESEVSAYSLKLKLKGAITEFSGSLKLTYFTIFICRSPFCNVAKILT